MMNLPLTTPMPRRLPPLTSLRAFEAVARRVSFKYAAEELFVTPGAVSQQVKKLEEDLGMPLLLRHNRIIEVTPAGEQLCAGLTDAFRRMRAAVEAARTAGETQCLAVACPAPFAAKWLVPRLGCFVEEHPETDIRIVATADPLDPDAADAHIRINIDEDARDGESLVEESFLPLVSPAFIERHELNGPQDLLRVPLISDCKGDLYRGAPTWRDWFRKLGLPAPDHCRAVDFGIHVDQAIDATASGVGAMLGPRVLAEQDIARGRLVSPWGPELKSDVHYRLSWDRDGLNDRIESFSAWLLDQFGGGTGPVVQAAA